MGIVLFNLEDGRRLVIERDRSAMAAVEAEEWEQRRLEIERQAELARREKKRRRAESEIAQRSQVPLLDEHFCPAPALSNISTFQHCT